LPRWDTTARCKEFLLPERHRAGGEAALEAVLATLPAALPRWHPFHRAQYLEAKTLMAGYLLAAQGDRMLMANSVEGRFPYLDHRVIEFANRLHPSLKMKVLNEKYVLKETFRRYLPPSILARHKQPYRAPDIAAFFAGQTPAYVWDMLGPDTIRRYGYFDAEKVRRLVEKIRQGRTIGFKDNMAFVGVLSTQIWHHLFVENLAQRLAPVTPVANSDFQNVVVRR
jgi:asparagine synthase (glutamine-hydrolysing)